MKHLNIYKQIMLNAEMIFLYLIWLYMGKILSPPSSSGNELQHEIDIHIECKCYHAKVEFSCMKVQ